MNVYLSFDVEIWCNSWKELDARFPASYDRYVFGGSRHGRYALPQTLEILARHGLHGVFFVEPLFAARFGVEHLARIVELIKAAGQEIQLHLHPEWTDELEKPPIRNASKKRQHLSYYTFDEQLSLIRFGKQLLREAGCDEVTAFRAGSFAANRDTFRALAQAGIGIDSSLNSTHPDSGGDLAGHPAFDRTSLLDEVMEVPMTVFRDGFGRPRPAQVGACSLLEIRTALASARVAGRRNFMILSHNFEMLKPSSSEPDWIVVRRFEGLCRFLEQQRDTLPTASLKARPEPDPECLPTQASKTATARRFIEQAMRRLQS